MTAIVVLHAIGVLIALAMALYGIIGVSGKVQKTLFLISAVLLLYVDFQSMIILLELLKK